MVRWALEEPTNPSVLRVHVDVELTDRTILTCPPGAPPEPLDRLFQVEAIRSIDLHRYRARLNLRPDADRAAAAAHAAGVLTSAWGPPAALEDDPGPRAFEASAASGRRVVAESAEMATGHATLAALFAVDGVSEAVIGEGVVLVRLGRVFAWDEAEDLVAEAVAG